MDRFGGQLMRPRGSFAINKDSRQLYGLVAWYTMMQPGGLVAYDAYLPNRHLTINGSLTWRSAPLGGHALDNGSGASGDYCNLGARIVTVPGSGVSEPLTMVCWFMSRDVTNVQTLMCLGDEGTNGLWRLFLHATQPGDPIGAQKQNTAGSTTGIASTSTGYVAGSWYHAAAVFSAANARAAYINGGSKGTNSTNVATPTPDEFLLFRSTMSAFREPLNGAIAEARVYNRALTDAEIYQLYDPATRWELYYPLHRRTYFAPPPPTEKARSQAIICG
jgi:hypothetical protein